MFLVIWMFYAFGRKKHDKLFGFIGASRRWYPLLHAFNRRNVCFILLQQKKVLMMPFLSFSSGRTLMALDWNRKNAPWFYWEEKKWNWNWNWKVTQSSCMKISRRIQTMLNFPGIINYTDLFIDVKDKKLTVCMNHSLGHPNWMSLYILFVLLSPLPFWWIDRILIAASFYHLETILAKQLLCTVLCTTHRL